ncbi:11489_t:CDS:2 [Entrophospora sp. SA101]|nr:11489_t:CDS:2 [Entrophospora sp. SA101]CAJ0832470.1 1041_t:CDS:2 [Entrophospora sp. SA101]
MEALFPRFGKIKDHHDTWEDYEIGFTHFIQITYKPDLDTFEKVWMHYDAINLKYNHQGGDILLVIKHKNKNEFGCIVIQVKNWAVVNQNVYDDVGRKLEIDYIYPEIVLGLSNFYEERTSGFEAMQSFVRARDDPFAREVNSEKIKIASLLSHMLPLFYQQIKQG